ncbi:UNVERIFIED_CONTAM: hypothetical protein K2H54_021841 [Gekko kuhli]
MQTMASVVSCYLEEEKGFSKITKGGLNQMVKEQFPHFEKEEIRPGGYRIRIPLTETRPGYSPFNFQAIPDADLFADFNLFADFLEMEILLGNLVIRR